MGVKRRNQVWGVKYNWSNDEEILEIVKGEYSAQTEISIYTTPWLFAHKYGMRIM